MDLDEVEEGYYANWIEDVTANGNKASGLDWWFEVTKNNMGE